MVLNHTSVSCFLKKNSYASVVNASYKEKKIENLLKFVRLHYLVISYKNILHCLTLRSKIKKVVNIGARVCNVHF